MNKNEKDKNILRSLASKIAEIAALPVQEEKRRLWRALNGLKPQRPMVTIDQVCWNEMNIDGILDLQCESEEAREYEQNFRRLLLQWELFPVDMVVEPFVRVYKAVHNSYWGIGVVEEKLATDITNDVVSHKYINQFNSIEDVQRIKMPVLSHDKAETKRRMDYANWLFDGVIPVREEGIDFSISIWDPVSCWMSVEGALFGFADNPEMMHVIAKRMSDGLSFLLDQAEEQGLLCHSQSLVHCTGAYSDELPSPNFNSEKPLAKDIWTFGLAQMFSTVSPSMFEEYEVNYVSPIFKRYGLVYYGCCDPLDGKMNEVKKIPNVRKISVSPWADKEKSACGIENKYVFSNKPNPAYIAFQSFNEEIVKKDLMQTYDICKRYNCPLEFIFKDISTVYNQPNRLKAWADIAMSIALR